MSCNDMIAIPNCFAATTALNEQLLEASGHNLESGAFCSLSQKRPAYDPVVDDSIDSTCDSFDDDEGERLELDFPTIAWEDAPNVGNISGRITRRTCSPVDTPLLDCISSSLYSPSKKRRCYGLVRSKNLLFIMPDIIYVYQSTPLFTALPSIPFTCLHDHRF